MELITTQYPPKSLVISHNQALEIFNHKFF